jgi:outer membrane protein TolC
MNKHIFFSIFLLLSIVFSRAEENEPIILDLEEAKARAENTSPDLRALNLQLLASNYSYQLGLRVFFPTLSIGFSQSDSVTYNSPADTTQKTVSFSLHQPLFDGGRTFFQREVQKLELTLQQYDYLKKREEIQDQTWQLFHQILLYEEKKRLQEELYRISLQQYEISKKELELGAATEIDFLDTELQIKKLEAELRKTKLDGEVLSYQLRTLCGLPQGRPVQLKGIIDFTYSGMRLNPLTERWLAVALDRNTDYRKLLFEAEKSKKEFRIAETTFIPTIGADVTFSLSGEGFPLYEPGFSFKLTFQFPFNETPTKIDMGATTNTIDQRTLSGGVNADILPSLTYLADKRLALLKIQMANLQLDSTEESLRFNIEQFLKNYSYEVENLALSKKTLQLLDRKQRVTKEQLGIGDIKRIDYLKAQNDYYSQEIAIRENILKIIAMERSFEQLLGLQPGELQKIVENESR